MEVPMEIKGAERPMFVSSHMIQIHGQLSTACGGLTTAPGRYSGGAHEYQGYHWRGQCLCLKSGMLQIPRVQCPWWP
ncbi:hypothetical protein CEXT_339371 [Caerostris extrusa]|uniref:Uncharacterized protein n=1 Tax=Caerostris extrusa TaxID=172846 RepID=A0AAV4TLK0_CAEEX|nr:hypothetical protein CEXT_339371 [Caerostris extrusa]